MSNLRYRQIHLDFHTSEKIPNIGQDFDAEEFALTLERASVDSITCFARCHHGMLYYASKANPELIHPHLKEQNLLEKQIDACHRRNIRTPIYTTIQWDYHISQKHPDWCCLTAEGGLVDYCMDKTSHIYEPGFYRTLCVNSPYRNFLKQHIKDIFDVVGTENVDGFFFDIVNIVDCSCQHCVKDMLAQGYNPKRKEDRAVFARKMIASFKQDLSTYIRSFKNDLSIFYNGGHINHQTVDAADAYTHWELESLPSGQWGYSHFTNTIRYARNIGKDCLAHTGKFHTMWGDFHSFKNKEALEYECFRMLAYNTKCLIGDQLDPNGKLSPAVYDLIGGVYSKIARKEPWCDNAVPLVDLAVFTPESLQNITGCGGYVPDEVNGCCTMLDELGYQFNIIESRSDWSCYNVVILPDTVVCDDTLKLKIQEYIQNGGSVLATGDSTLDWDRKSFMIPELGITYLGKEDKWPSFILPNEIIGNSLPKTEHVMYLQGNKIKPIGAAVLLDTIMPYFSRTWENFCSHRHTPSSSEVGTPALTRMNNTMYFSHPVFTIYDQLHPKWCKTVVDDALKQFIPQQIVRNEGPTTLTVTVNEQRTEQRYVVHALHYIPIKNSQELYTIEDVIPLHEVHFSLSVPNPVHSVMLVPEREPLKFAYKKGRVTFVIPKIEGHIMVALQYKKEKQ